LSCDVLTLIRNTSTEEAPHHAGVVVRQESIKRVCVIRAGITANDIIALFSK
jgi:hypothetical protein